MNPVTASTHVALRCPYYLVAILLMTATAAQGQANPDSVKLRNDCRFAAQVIESGRPAPHRSKALDIIHLCGGVAVPALVRLWEQNDLSDADRVKLRFASISALSDSLVRTLLHTVDSPNRPVMVRGSALAVLVSIVDPSLFVTAKELVEDPHGDTWLLSRRSHRYGQVGRESLTVPVLTELTTLVRRLSADDPSPEIWHAAAIIAYSFEAYGLVPAR